MYYILGLVFVIGAIWRMGNAIDKNQMELESMLQEVQRELKKIRHYPGMSDQAIMEAEVWENRQGK